MSCEADMRPPSLNQTPTALSTLPVNVNVNVNVNVSETEREPRESPFDSMGLPYFSPHTSTCQPYRPSFKFTFTFTFTEGGERRGNFASLLGAGGEGDPSAVVAGCAPS